MGVVSRWRSVFGPQEERETYPLAFQDWVNYFTYQGLQYPLMGGGTLVGNQEKVGQGFEGYIRGAYAANGVVFACELTRLLHFSEARFQWQEIRKGRPGTLFSSPELEVLSTPWAGATTGDLLTRMLICADFGGNAFVVRRSQGLKVLRPDWVTIVSGSPNEDSDPWDIEAETIGFIYVPGGPGSGNDPVILDVNAVAHFAPVPDPLSPTRGMSWITPVLREIQADQSATTHKEALFSKGATPNMVVKFDATVTKELFDTYVKLIREGHEGAANAYKTMFLGAGADVQVVGANLRQLDFKATQGAGETRIAAAAGVPPVIVGLSEGLSSATYSNYGQARRRFADGTMRPLWRNASGSLQRIVNTGQTRSGRARLWYDDRDIAFLQEDRKDLAEIQVANASAMKQLIDAGYDPDSVTDAVTSGDFSRLTHTGFVSVQLQEPGAPQSAPQSNGKTPAEMMPDAVAHPE